jgi:hypothetical protein
VSPETAAGSVAEAWRMSVDALWDEWVLAEIACELALFLWRTAPTDERALAHREYVAALRQEGRIARLLARTRSAERDKRRRRTRSPAVLARI